MHACTVTQACLPATTYVVEHLTLFGLLCLHMCMHIYEQYNYEI